MEAARDQTFARVDLRAANASERVLWYLTDHLNSVRLVLDESGGVLDQIAYDAFGNIVARLNPLLDNPILFTSREFDAETGLYYQPRPLPRPVHRPLDDARPARLRRRRRQPVPLCRQPGHAGHRPKREHRLAADSARRWCRAYYWHLSGREFWIARVPWEQQSTMGRKL
jgi:hypothetical protein